MHYSQDGSLGVVFILRVLQGALLVCCIVHTFIARWDDELLVTRELAALM
jgi:hypothetical protein